MQSFLQTVFAIAYVIKQQYVRAQDTDSNGDDFNLSKSIDHAAENTDVYHMHNLTFIALIDIVFTDGTKRTCTGTIIHDNVIITARHCFGKTYDKFIQPEITTSFVVIGSKKMFESGYEQYLPIERIVSHPKYKGWSADLALVYTFAGMMSDKPGTILPLAGEQASLPTRSIVTLFSWGHYTENVQFQSDNELKSWKKHTQYPLRAKRPLFSSEENTPQKTKKTKTSTAQKSHTKASKKPKADKKKKNKKQKVRAKKTTVESRSTQAIYRSRTSSEEYTEESLNANNEGEIRHKLVDDDDAENNYGSIFTNWRRNMGSEKNKLAVQNFTFVSMQTCEEMMKKSVPEKNGIKNPNEFICYSSEGHLVTDEDAGAPAVRRGHLVAVTVGGMECGERHLAIGIKISCFCSWIAENLPDGGKQIKCCEDCCDNSNPPPPDEDKEESTFRVAKKKKGKS